MAKESKLFARQLSKGIVQLRNKLDLEKKTSEETEQYVCLFIARSLLSECELLSDRNQIVSSYFTLHVKPYIYDVLSQLNELTVIRIDPVIELTQRLYIERYKVACGDISDSVISAWFWQDNMPKAFIPNDTKPHKFVRALSNLVRLIPKG